jgi:hypothetical protein
MTIMTSTVSVIYCLTAPLLALKRDGGDRPNITTLRAGEIVQLTSQVRESGLVDVLCNGDTYTVFESEIRNCGDLIASSKAGLHSAA